VRLLVLREGKDGQGAASAHGVLQFWVSQPCAFPVRLDLCEGHVVPSGRTINDNTGSLMLNTILSGNG
jgi:hypothetical protein